MQRMVVCSRLTVLFATDRIETNQLVNIGLERNKIDIFVTPIRLDVLTFSIVSPLRERCSFLLRKATFKRKKFRSFNIDVLYRIFMKLGPAIGIDFDHFQIFIAFLEIFSHLDMVLMLVCLLEILQQLEEYRIAHLKSPLFGLLEQTTVLILQLLTLQPATVQLHLFLIAEMRSAFLLQFLLSSGRSSHGLVIDLVVPLPLLVNLRE